MAPYYRLKAHFQKRSHKVIANTAMGKDENRLGELRLYPTSLPEFTESIVYKIDGKHVRQVLSSSSHSTISSSYSAEYDAGPHKSTVNINEATAISTGYSTKTHTW